MAEVSNYILPREMQRDLKKVSGGNYSHNRLNPIVAPGPITTSGTFIEWELPCTRVTNHYFDRLEFNINYLPLATGGNKNILLFRSGTHPIKSLQLVTRGGQYIARIDNFDKYKDVLTYTTNSDKFDLMPSNDNDQYLTAFGGRFSELSLLNQSLSTYRLTDGVRYAGDTLLEPSYYSYTNATYAAGGTNPPLIIPVNIDMNLIYDSFFSVSQDINFGEILLLRIELNAPQTLGRECILGAVGAPVGTVGFPFALYTISNPYYYMAYQQNQTIINMVNDLQTQNILIPFIRTVKMGANPGNDAQYTLSNRLNTSDGARLLRMYWLPYNTAENDFTLTDHSNVSITDTTGENAPTKVKSFFIEVDNARRLPYNLNCALFEDYKQLKPLLKNSCVRSATHYSSIMCWIENFANNYGISEEFEYDKSKWVDGAPIETEIKIDITYIATATGLQNYIFFVTQKMLTISKNAGISVHS